MPPRPSTLALLAGVALLGSATPAARAADLDENYGYAEAPQEVPMAQIPQTKVEFGTGWYVRGDLGLTTLPSVTLTQPTVGSTPDLELKQSSKLGYTAGLGAGYQILPHVRADVSFDFHDPIKVTTSNFANTCPQSYQQVQDGSTTSTSSITAVNNSVTNGNVSNSTTQILNPLDGTSNITEVSTNGPNSVTQTDPLTGITTTTYSPVTVTKNADSVTNDTTQNSTKQTIITTLPTTSGGTTTTTTITTTPKYVYNLVNGACNNQTSAYLTRFDVLVNAYYDITTWHGITPYVGVGLGLSFGHFSSTSTYLNGDGSSYSPTLTNPSTLVATHYDLDESRSGNYYNFAYALMAGVSFDVLPHTKIDVGYRYLNEGHVLGVNLHEHQARAGLRYMIDN